MSKKTISPRGCKDCINAWVDRCGLTGHKQQWHVNAKHHCKEFKLDQRNQGEYLNGDTGTVGPR